MLSASDMSWILNNCSTDAGTTPSSLATPPKPIMIYCVTCKTMLPPKTNEQKLFLLCISTESTIASQPATCLAFILLYYFSFSWGKKRRKEDKSKNKNKKKKRRRRRSKWKDKEREKERQMRQTDKPITILLRNIRFNIDKIMYYPNLPAFCYKYDMTFTECHLHQWIFNVWIKAII